MTYQIYALKYGERDTKESQFFFREASQKPLTLHFFVWVILGGPHPIVVDTGCTAVDAQAKELRAFVSPADMLAKGTVVLTSDASHFYRNIERRDPVQIITNLPQMLAGFEKIDALAGAKERVVVGHDPEVATRFDQVEPGIVKIA